MDLALGWEGPVGHTLEVADRLRRRGGRTKGGTGEVALLNLGWDVGRFAGELGVEAREPFEFVAQGAPGLGCPAVEGKFGGAAVKPAAELVEPANKADGGRRGTG